MASFATTDEDLAYRMGACVKRGDLVGLWNARFLVCRPPPLPPGDAERISHNSASAAAEPALIGPVDRVLILEESNGDIQVTLHKNAVCLEALLYNNKKDCEGDILIKSRFPNVRVTSHGTNCRRFKL